MPVDCVLERAFPNLVEAVEFERDALAVGPDEAVKGNGEALLIGPRNGLNAADDSRATQSEQQSNAAILGAGIVPLPGQDPGGVLLRDDQAVPVAGDAPRTEAEAVLLETLRLEEMERRRRSLRTEPLVLSYRNSDPGADATAAAGAQVPNALSGLLQATGSAQTPQAALPAVTAESTVSTAGDFLELLTALNDRELAATAQPAPRAGDSPLPLALVGPETETPVAGRPTDPAGWDRIYEGSFLEAVLVTELSGDFPGPVLANVSVPFYSADRQRVLTPRSWANWRSAEAACCRSCPACRRASASIAAWALC